MPSRAHSAGNGSLIAFKGAKAREDHGIDEIRMRDDRAMAPLMILWTVSLEGRYSTSGWGETGKRSSVAMPKYNMQSCAMTQQGK